MTGFHRGQWQVRHKQHTQGAGATSCACCAITWLQIIYRQPPGTIWTFLIARPNNAPTPIHPTKPYNHLETGGTTTVQALQRRGRGEKGCNCIRHLFALPPASAVQPKIALLLLSLVGQVGRVALARVRAVLPRWRRFRCELLHFNANLVHTALHASRSY